MSSAASSLRSSISPSPAVASELAISSAALESPSAEITAAFFCCSACEETGKKKKGMEGEQNERPELRRPAGVSPCQSRDKMVLV